MDDGERLRGAAGDWDRAYVEVAVREARRRKPRTLHLLFDFIEDTLLLRWLEPGDEDRDAVLEFVHKFQQNTGPVMATSFYSYDRLNLPR